jgi:acyl-coenzyme A thioesterase PaaI-like protein
MKEALQRYGNCFVCGDSNKSGLDLQFYFEDGRATAEFTPDRNLEGFKGILHGGILSAVLDEVMFKAVQGKRILTVTARMDIKFKKPAKIGEKLLLEGWIKEDKGKMIITEGTVYTTDSTLIAEAEGSYFRVNEEMRKELQRSLE